MLGLVKDVGDLALLVQAKEGVREVERVDETLAHELADCLWSVLVLADRYSVDLERAFADTMDDLEARLA
jgi:NTP pyrophosphatase (non-canonical NTP hydrolase)